MIVIVDDEESVRRALKRLLMTAGYRVETFGTGTEFFKTLKKMQPACVILDVQMPKMTGYDIQRRLGEVKSAVPVIMISGYDTAESQKRAMRAGAAAFLKKPVDDVALFDAISAAIGARSGD